MCLGNRFDFMREISGAGYKYQHYLAKLGNINILSISRILREDIPRSHWVRSSFLIHQKQKRNYCQKAQFTYKFRSLFIIRQVHYSVVDRVFTINIFIIQGRSCMHKLGLLYFLGISYNLEHKIS
jgi:hypothetical protein